MTHAAERAIERLTDAGVDPDEELALARRIAASFPTTDVAVRLRVLADTYGDDSTDILSRDSNGDEVWAVCRSGWVRTIMLRRSSQPRTPDAFRVARVLRIEVK